MCYVASYWLHNGWNAIHGDYSSDNFKTDLALGPLLSVMPPVAIATWIWSVDDPVGEAKDLGVRLVKSSGIPTNGTDALITVLAGPAAVPIRVAKWLWPF
jgi:hypothetical protein